MSRQQDLRDGVQMTDCREDVAVDVLIPTYNRPTALAVTLTGLAMQTLPRFRVVVSDQSEDDDTYAGGELRSVVRLLKARDLAVLHDPHKP